MNSYQVWGQSDVAAAHSAAHPDAAPAADSSRRKRHGAGELVVSLLELAYEVPKSAPPEKSRTEIYLPTSVIVFLAPV